MVSHQHYVLYIKDRDFYHQIKYSYDSDSATYLSSFHIVAALGENLDSTNEHYHVLDKAQLPRHLDPHYSELVIIDSVKYGKGREAAFKHKLQTDTLLISTEKSLFDIYQDVIVPILKIIGLESQHEYHKTVSETSIADYAKSLFFNRHGQKEPTVLLLSGDTSIHEFVNSLPVLPDRRSIRFGIVPLGTGNALALELGLTSPVQGVFNIFSANAKETAFPLYQAQFSPGSYIYDPDITEKTDGKIPVEKLTFFVVLSWGLHAAIVADSNSPELRKIGNDRFKIAALENIHHIKQDYHGAIVIEDSQNHSLPPTLTSHSYFLLGLNKALEPGFVISPHSNLLEAKAYIIDIPFKQTETSIDEENKKQQAKIFDNLPTVKFTLGPGITQPDVKKDFTKDNQFLLDVLTKVYDNSAHVHDPLVNYTEFKHSLQISLYIDDNQDLRKKRVCVDGRTVVVGNTSQDESMTSRSFVKLKYLGSSVNGWDLHLIV